MKRYKILFKGRVQGVGFRYTSKVIADKLNLTGTIENLSNGDVECFIQGPDKKINEFVNSLQNQKNLNISSFDKTELEVESNESTYKIIG